VKIYKVITKKQVQRVKVMNNKAREGITKVIVKKVKRFSNNNKRSG
jgi:hypothetical protein